MTFPKKIGRQFTPGSQTRSHLRESRLPALVHNILIPVSLLAVVGFNWAALCAKQTQYLIHFVPMQSPFFSFHTTHSANVCAILVQIFCHFVSKDPSIFMLCNIFSAKNAILCCKTYKIIWWYQKKIIPLQSFSTRCSKSDATKRYEILRSRGADCRRLPRAR